MENSSGLQSRRTNNDHLGVNKIGKSIRKSPLNQPTFPNPPALAGAGAGAGARPTQPQVYNISKTEFRSIVQQLTGSPAPAPAAPPPVTVQTAEAAANSPKTASLRLQRIRPPPLSPIARVPIPLLHNPNPPPPVVSGAGGGMWTNAGESPISVYMRHLQNSITETGQSGPAAPPPSSGLLPTPPPATAALPALASPTAQFGVPSPSGFLNLLSPRSYPLLSPGFQFPPPLTPNFAFSAQSPGILGPAPFAPPSPGLHFPPSPSGLFPILSPRWRE